MFFKFNAITSDSASQLLEAAEEMRRTSLKPVLGARDDFGKKLSEAVKQRLAARNRIAATSVSSSSSGESFAEKLKRAVEKHPKSQEQARKNAEKERSRYRKLQPRPHTKGECETAAACC